jgi:hypothetical protein
MTAPAGGEPRCSRCAHRIGVAAQWESLVAVGLRDTVTRLLPGSSFARSLVPILDWTA